MEAEFAKCEREEGSLLKEVAEATGYTIGHISQIERDLKSPFTRST